MARPCKDEHAPAQATCHWCERLGRPGEVGDHYRRLWGEPDFPQREELGEPVNPKPPPSAAPARKVDISRWLKPRCKYLGAATGKDLPCDGCGGTLRRTMVHACAIHGECLTGFDRAGSVRRCQDCSDHVAAEGATPVVDNRRRLIIANKLSPGDILVMMAAVEALHRTYPGQYLTAVDSPCADLYKHDPLVSAIDAGAWERVEMHYPLVHHSHERPEHFMAGYVEHLSQTLGVPLTLRSTRPRLVLSAFETDTRPVIAGLPAGPYWLINAGVKPDFTCKGWSVGRYAEVVRLLTDLGVTAVQVGEAHHLHQPLEGAVNLIGKTTLRQLIHLAAHADFACGPVTFLQHIMAALQKPYLCLAGAREPRHWLDYPTQVTFSTTGRLSCPALEAPGRACWRSRVVPLGDGNDKDNSLCALPVTEGGCAIPKCLAIITPEEVVAAARGLYDNGVIVR